MASSSCTDGSWRARLDAARAAGHVGDLLLLADEAPLAECQAEACIDAAKLLREAGQYDFALEQLDRALAIDSHNAAGLREQALCRQHPVLAEAAGGRWQPRQVLLFSGHLVDAPDRPTPRFPADKVARASEAIAATLVQLDAGSEDLALTQGACGGDLLFTEACRRQGTRVLWLQPFAEADFITASVLGGGADWHRRYLESRMALAEPPRAAPEALGPVPPGHGDSYPYERCNLWLLYSALAWGPDRLSLIALWDGAGGDGAGGTEHMIEEVRRRTGRVHWIDTRKL
jgi:tetratricopeptide (TPR) repeat protein